MLVPSGSGTVESGVASGERLRRNLTRAGARQIKLYHGCRNPPSHTGKNESAAKKKGVRVRYQEQVSERSAQVKGRRVPRESGVRRKSSCGRLGSCFASCGGRGRHWVRADGEERCGRTGFGPARSFTGWLEAAGGTGLFSGPPAVQCRLMHDAMQLRDD